MRTSKQIPKLYPTTVIACALLVGAGTLFADGPTTDPRTAVNYIEIPKAGPKAENGRVLGHGGLRKAVDINSSVEVTIDGDTLSTALLPHAPEVVSDQEIAGLLDRLSALEEAVENLPKFRKAYLQEVRLYEETVDERLTDELAGFEEARRARSEIELQVFQSLEKSLRIRLESTMSVEDAQAGIEELTDPIFENVGPNEPVNITALGRVLNAEIRAVEDLVTQKLEAFADTALAMELRGHLVGRDGDSFAIPLPGHNTVEAGIEQRFQKINFSISDEEQSLLEQYQELADQIRTAQADGESILDGIRTAFSQQRSPIIKALKAAETAVENAGGSLEILAAWADGDRLHDWIEGPAHDALTESNQPTIERFEAILFEVEEDFRTLKDLGDLAGAVEDSQATDAVTLLLHVLSNRDLKTSVSRALTPQVWANRLSEVRELIEEEGPTSLAPLAQIDGPIKAWNDAASSLKAVREALDPVREAARQLLARIRGVRVAQLEVNLPEPRGQKRRDLRSGDDLNTRFNLRTLPRARERGDEIRLAYTFYSGEEELEGRGWTDYFPLEVFGWQIEALASVALVRFGDADDEEQWEPTAPISYQFHRRSWPDDDESGLARRDGPFFTGGFSIMPLDFGDEESVELGLAATLGFLDNFLIVGYGVNLHAGEEEFFFLSLRPFSLGKLFQPAKGD